MEPGDKCLEKIAIVEATIDWKPSALRYLMKAPNSVQKAHIIEWASAEEVLAILKEWKRKELDTFPLFSEARTVLGSDPNLWIRGSSEMVSLMSDIQARKKSKSQSSRHAVAYRWAGHARLLARAADFPCATISKSAQGDVKAAYRLLLDVLLDLQTNPMTGVFSRLLGMPKNLGFLVDDEKWSVDSSKHSETSLLDSGDGGDWEDCDELSGYDGDDESAETMIEKQAEEIEDLKDDKKALKKENTALKKEKKALKKEKKALKKKYAALKARFRVSGNAGLVVG